MRTENNNTIVGWAHRDADGELYITDCPDVIKIGADGYWEHDWGKGDCCRLPYEFLPEVKWEDEKPIPVTLTVTLGHSPIPARSKTCGIKKEIII